MFFGKRKFHSCFFILLTDKGCVSLCVENMQKASGDLLPLEVVEMFATVFCLLKDSADVTQTLLDDFRSCQGYNFLTEFMLRFTFIFPFG